MKEETVSLIVPCYQVAQTLQAFLDSVLRQSYPYIQLIAVDDGSTDETGEILRANAPAFQARGFSFVHVTQENAGLGAAINTGLRHVAGEYLCWADPDDLFAPDSFEKRVAALRAHPECGVVSSDALYFQAGELNYPVGRASDGLVHTAEPWQFEYLLRERSIFCPGCHMVLMRAFDDVNPKREIYPARRGQNWQMLLPVYYKYPRYFLSEPLYTYIIYPQSMSRGDKKLTDVLLRWKEHETILLETLARMQLSEAERTAWQHTVRTRYAKKRFDSAIDFRSRKIMRREYRALRALHENTPDIRRRYWRNLTLLGKAIGRLCSRFGRNSTAMEA